MVEEYQFSYGKSLRCGYTTGSCATAASKAAAVMLLTKERVEVVRIDTPKGIVLNLEPLEVERGENYVSCAIRKDSLSVVFIRYQWLPSRMASLSVGGIYEQRISLPASCL